MSTSSEVWQGQRELHAVLEPIRVRKWARKHGANFGAGSLRPLQKQRGTRSVDEMVLAGSAAKTGDSLRLLDWVAS